MHKILVVEDDPVINQVIREFLSDRGYEVTSVFDGKEALEQFKQQSFDLIILDIMIPIYSGLEVLEKIRQTSKVPVMMLTAVSDEYTQLVSFNHLISDYVVKPFSPLILVKRVENILRNSSADSVISIGDVCIHVDKGLVFWGNEEVNLTKKEYEVLHYLAMHGGAIPRL